MFGGGKAGLGLKFGNIQVAFFGGGLFVWSTQSSCEAISLADSTRNGDTNTYNGHLYDILALKEPLVLFGLSPEVRR